MLINQIMLYSLIALTAALLLRGVWRQQDMLRFPFLAAAVVGGWFIPQAIGLSNDEFLPEGGFALTMFVAILSLGATVIGERLVPARASTTVCEYDEKILVVTSIILTIIGIGAEHLLLTTNMTLNDSGQATGISTIYFFLMRSQYYGLAFAILLLLQRFSLISLVIVCVNMFMIGAVIIFGGRRGAAIDLALIIGSAFWFQRRLLLSRKLTSVVIVVATLFVNSIAQYRTLVVTVNRLPTIDEILQIDFLGTMAQETTKGSYEATNAVYYIAAADKTGYFDFGLSYWNYFVFRYIPAQIVGKGVKDGLTVDLPDVPFAAYQYERHNGTTFTGFADSFSSFWLFGALVFALIAAIMQRWWRDAMIGDFQAKLFYCVTVSDSVEALSHGTQWFLMYLPQVFIFTVPFLYLARRRPHRDRSVQEHYPLWPRPRSISF